MNEGIVDLSAIIRGKGTKLVGGNMYLVNVSTGWCRRTCEMNMRIGLFSFQYTVLRYYLFVLFKTN